MCPPAQEITDSANPASSGAIHLADCATGIKYDDIAMHDSTPRGPHAGSERYAAPARILRAPPSQLEIHVAVLLLYNHFVAQTTQVKFSADGQVASNPGVLACRPVFTGTRVPVATLFDYLCDGLSLDYFLESFPSVSKVQAQIVLRAARRQIEPA